MTLYKKILVSLVLSVAFCSVSMAMNVNPEFMEPATKSSTVEKIEITSKINEGESEDRDTGRTLTNNPDEKIKDTNNASIIINSDNANQHKCLDIVLNFCFPVNQYVQGQFLGQSFINGYPHNIFTQGHVETHHKKVQQVVRIDLNILKEAASKK